MVKRSGALTAKREYTLTPEALKKIRISFQEFTDKAPEE